MVLAHLRWPSAGMQEGQLKASQSDSRWRRFPYLWRLLGDSGIYILSPTPTRPTDTCKPQHLRE
jgi:hypothetical protein